MQWETPRTQSSCAQRAVCPWNPSVTVFSYFAVINYFAVFSTLPVFISFTYIYTNTAYIGVSRQRGTCRFFILKKNFRRFVQKYVQDM